MLVSRFTTALQVFLILSSTNLQSRAPSSYLNNCKSLIQSLLKKSNRSIVIEHDFQTTLGVEFEGLMPDDLSYKDLGEILSKILSQKKPDISYEVEEVIYMTRAGGVLRKALVKYKKDGRDYIYTIKYDETLSPRFTTKAVEITTPILHSSEDLDDFTAALRKLKEHYIEESPKDGGIHIHYALKKTPSLEQTYKLYKSIDQMYNSLITTFKVGEQRMHFLERSKLKELVEKLRKKTMNDVSTIDINENELRNERTLVRFVERYGTVELRVFNSTMSQNRINIYADFSNRFFRAWENKDEELIKYFETHESADVLKVSEIIGARLDLLKSL
jgi:hypothetical protein